MTDHRIALVLGATGGIGGEMARRLAAGGWRVKALTRHTNLLQNGDIEWIRGDAMVAADVARAAQGTSLIVHAVNPPGYRDWDTLVMPMLENTIAAARRENARILLPGTVYNYGPDVAAEVDEDAPQNPATRKGAIRAAMERRLHDVSEDGVRSLIVRAGDFFGPRAANNWFSQGLVKPDTAVAAVSYPGARGIGHQWAYLPDLAEAMTRLVSMEDRLRPFERVHMAGHWDPDGSRMIDAIRAATGRADLPARRFPWWLVTLASPFVVTFREMREMRYLWHTPLRLTNARMRELLGEEPHTPWNEAVSTALQGIGAR
jgi:nucleoside-diphosphate-sugar epimerase